MFLKNVVEKVEGSVELNFRLEKDIHPNRKLKGMLPTSAYPIARIYEAKP